MAWWGKLIGGTFGFMFGGPLGAVIGAALGHNFDHGYSGLHGESISGPGAGSRERVQMAFFSATFAVMGHVSKADGQVSRREIDLARQVMAQMGLNEEMRTAAMQLFNEGKKPDFPLDDIVEQFRRECHGRRNLIRMFLEMQLHAAYADGVVHASERRVLEHCAQLLRFPAAELRHLEDLVRAAREFGPGGGRVSPEKKLADAYKVLGVSENAGDAEVKKAYRRMMNQHHPDKLVSKGLPEEMMQMATEKTREIKSAWETIKKARSQVR